ncbi:MAG: C40 family peptidase [Rhizobiales bacterium]|nr:C40 family peptidase [Hyphomicrobiales bacterium]
MTETGAATRLAVLAEARGWIGTPYRHQGRTKGVGCDCLGLVLGVWRALYGSVPETPAVYGMSGADDGAADALLEGAARHMDRLPAGAERPGDLLVLRWRPGLPARHFGILSAENRFIHAYHGMAVTDSCLVPQWRRRIAAAFAFPEISRG